MVVNCGAFTSWLVIFSVLGADKYGIEIDVVQINDYVDYINQ